MVDYIEAIKRPFSDLKKLSIGAVLNMVPVVSIVTGFFATGYGLNAAKSAMRGRSDLDEWSDWGSLFVKGLLATVIGLIWAIPSLIVLMVVAWSTLGDLVTSLGDPTTLLSTATPSGIGMIVAGLLFLLTVYISPAAILSYAEKGVFNAGFDTKKVFAITLTSTWLKAWLIAMVWAIVVGIASGMLSALLAVTIVLPFVIGGYTGFIILISVLTMLGEAYAEA